MRSAECPDDVNCSASGKRSQGSTCSISSTSRTWHMASVSLCRPVTQLQLASLSIPTRLHDELELVSLGVSDEHGKEGV